MSDESETPATAQFHIADVHPMPDDETLAVITAAIEVAWPQPAPAAATDVVIDGRWRFGFRRWNDRPIPRRTWGRR